MEQICSQKPMRTSRMKHMVHEFGEFLLLFLDQGGSESMQIV